MTKTQMIDYIEKSGMVLYFSRSSFNHRLKKDVERFYNMAVEYNAKKGSKNE